jgi:predicted RND superfamily exporter protein
VSVDQDEVRFSARIRDSERGLRRNALLQKIRTELPEKADLKPDQVRLGGMLVLYNNMLQSLFRSQITTLGITILALMAMFLVLFRSLKISLIAIFPNVLSVGLVLGFMGWMGIPLDMMTITIAAISVGIAVDDTIHYIHRFKEEFRTDRNYLNTLHRCHSSIGHAMYYTSVTIIIGFSILAMSNFIPSIYFGLLTGLAMIIALIAALTLLPQLIILVKPFGHESLGNES